MSTSATMHEAVTPGLALAGIADRGTPSGLYIGGAGAVAMTMQGPAGATSITYANLAAGVVHPLSPVSIESAGTTATGIVAVWLTPR